MVEEGFVAFAAASAVAQVALAAALLRWTGAVRERWLLAILLALNGAVAAIYAARAIVGFDPTPGWPAILEDWGMLVDAPTPLLIAALALRLDQRWSGPWRGALFLAWAALPAWVLLNPAEARPPFVFVYNEGGVRLAYAALVVVAARQLERGGPDAALAAWLLAAFGTRALEFAVMDLALVPGWYAAPSTLATLALPWMVLAVALAVAARAAARAWRQAPNAERVALFLFASGALFGLAFLAAAPASGGLTSFVITFTLFVVRPAGLAVGTMGAVGLVTVAVVFLGAATAGALAAGFGAVFPGLTPLARWAFGVAVAAPVVYAAWHVARDALARRRGATLGQRVEELDAELRRRFPGPVDAAVAQRVARAPPPVRVLLALRGTEQREALYAVEASQAGLCALAGVHYKKLAGVIRGLEADHGQAPGGLVEDYGVGRAKYYRLTRRGAEVAAEAAERLGLAAASPLEVGAALLARRGAAAAPGPSRRPAMGRGAPRTPRSAD